MIHIHIICVDHCQSRSMIFFHSASWLIVCNSIALKFVYIDVNLTLIINDVVRENKSIEQEWKLRITLMFFSSIAREKINRNHFLVFFYRRIFIEMFQVSDGHLMSSDEMKINTIVIRIISFLFIPEIIKRKKYLKIAADFKRSLFFKRQTKAKEPHSLDKCFW